MQQCGTRVRVSPNSQLAGGLVLRSILSVSDAPPSPLTLLRSRTLYGRPDFKQVFTALARGIDGGGYLPGREGSLKTRLGVFYCGVS